MNKSKNYWIGIAFATGLVVGAITFWLSGDISFAGGMFGTCMLVGVILSRIQARRNG